MYLGGLSDIMKSGVIRFFELCKENESRSMETSTVGEYGVEGEGVSGKGLGLEKEGEDPFIM